MSKEVGIDLAAGFSQTRSDMVPRSSITIGIDIGGTFTDFVVYDPSLNQIETFKLLSTPHNPAEAVLSGLQKVFGKQTNGDSRVINIVHGSTVATNALLERKGARTALITTRGFADILQIGRQNRPELYNLLADPPPPLVPAELRFEADERVDAQGRILQALNPDQVEKLIPVLRECQVESLAVCLLFSFLHPDHEALIAKRFRSAGFYVSASHEILPEYREYERTSTTVVNAYVSPVLDHYLACLENGLTKGSRLRVMQSNGGAIQAGAARRNGVQCILSGPAGGVVGCHHIANLALPASISLNEVQGVRVITFDMGGTSTDVSLIEEKPQLTSEGEVSGCPIRIPMLSIHTIGAGGGSIARVDAGGALRVGPESAGVDPGPACYGKGEVPTVTDANLVLGRLAAEYFLDGEILLDERRARQVLTQLGRLLDFSPQQAALGIVQVTNAHMMRALRLISVERGFDPRRFTLLSFGGAGGLHAADLARSLGIPRVLVPPMASTLSAFGMLVADIVKDYSQTVMLPGETPLDDLEKRLEPLVERGRQEVKAEGLSMDRITIERSADLRYAGQSYELTIPFNPQLLADFHAHHQRMYGYSRPDAPVEIVNVRVQAVGKVQPPVLNPGQDAGPDPAHAFLGLRRVVFPAHELEIPFFRGEALLPGNRLKGPAVVVRTDTTILIGSQDHAEVDSFQNVFISVGIS